MTCPYLEYRQGDASRSFDAARAYCTVVDEFVQPMRADVCNDRYSLDHATDCEFYLVAESEEDADADGGTIEAVGGTTETASGSAETKYVTEETGDGAVETDDGSASDG